MTQDFIQDFVDKLEQEGLSYIIVVGHKDKRTGLTSGADLNYNITNWRTLPTMSVEEDIVGMLRVTVFDNIGFKEQCAAIQKDKDD